MLLACEDVSLTYFVGFREFVTEKDAQDFDSNKLFERE